MGMTTPLDSQAVAEELQAMKAVAEVLAPLSSQQRGGIIDWVVQFRGLTGEQT